MIPTVGLNAAVHVRCGGNLPFGIPFQPRVDTADVLTTHQSHAGKRGANSKVFPVLAGNLSRPERSGEDGHLHLDLLVPAVFGLCTHARERSRIGITLNASRQAVGAKSIPLYVQVRVVYRVVLVASCGDFTKGTRI